MSRMSDRKQRRRRIKRRYKNVVRGTLDRPRLTVFRSLRHLYVQVIDDDRDTIAVHATVLGDARHGAVRVDIRARYFFQYRCGIDQHFSVDLNLGETRRD